MAENEENKTDQPKETQKVVDKSGTMQSVSLKDYLLAQEKAKNKKPFKIPMPIVLTVLTPFILVFCLGIYFLPYMIYLISTSPSAPSPEERDRAYEAGITYAELMQQRKDSRE